MSETQGPAPAPTPAPGPRGPLGVLAALDRRFIYLAMAFAVALPMIAPVRLPIVISKEVESFHREIE